MTKEFILDGSKIRSLDSFYDEVRTSLALDDSWGRNLDAFDDILSGGCSDIPEDEFRLRWTDSDASKEHLGYSETVRQLWRRLERCHPTTRDSVRAQMIQAEKAQGQTVFDWLIDIIRSKDRIHLILE